MRTNGKTQMLTGSDPRAIVIGGGATGCGVARDLSLRGFKITLIEFGDLGSGTSSRFHGMLQSGARYVVSDTEYGAECMRERLIIARLVPEAVEQTGGLFVSLPEDPPEYADQFLECCQIAKIPAKELDPEQVMTQEPAISRAVRRAFSVPDATIQSWRLVNGLADDVKSRGGTVLTRHQVTGFDVAGGRVQGVRVAGPQGPQVLEADVVINAAGPWSTRVAAMVGESVDLELGKGSILVFSHRMVSRAINRCRPPSSHDILVPTGTVSLFGTTSEVVDDPDNTQVHPEEIQQLLDNAEPLLPDARSYRAFRAWAGVRPLYKPKDWITGKPLPRRHSVIEHGINGLEGFFTVCGGSLTTHRSMAEDLGDRVCRTLGIDAECTSATTPLIRQTDQSGWRPAESFHHVESTSGYAKIVCECESVDHSDLTKLIAEEGIMHLHDLRRRLRIGFGPCQGSFCGSRVAELLAKAHPGYDASQDLGAFWTERLKGCVHTAWGPQARQALLSDMIHRETFGLRFGAEIVPEKERR